MDALQPPCNLLGRPLAFKLAGYCPAQHRPASKLAQLGTQGTLKGGLIRARGPIAKATAIAPNLATDRRWRTPQIPRDAAKGHPRPQPPGNLLAFA